MTAPNNYRYVSHVAIWSNDGIIRSMKLPSTHQFLRGMTPPGSSCIEGFLDNNRKFLNRSEAMKLAFSAGQLKPNGSGFRRKDLYVEDLIA